MGQHAADRLVNDDRLKRLRRSVGQSVDHGIPKASFSGGFSEDSFSAILTKARSAGFSRQLPRVSQPV